MRVRLHRAGRHAGGGGGRQRLLADTPGLSEAAPETDPAALPLADTHSATAETDAAAPAETEAHPDSDTDAQADAAP
ncbi:hypothetical protein [Streptomyces hokutonensis]|uniref:hypothetical protein n=1 Tax=Streptomyces hokutonensis TaxID=1306990 RepID=UPI0036D00813